MNKFLNILGFVWSLPITLIGIFLWFLSLGHREAKYLGDLKVVYVPRFPWWFPSRFYAQCMGSIILCRELSIDKTTLAHELEHSRQCDVFGIFMLLLYPIASLLGLMYKSPYKLNFFEIMARKKAEQIFFVER